LKTKLVVFNFICLFATVRYCRLFVLPGFLQVFVGRLLLLKVSVGSIVMDAAIQHRIF